MPFPPTGTVTFLFTDIEGSTKLWEQHPEAMRPALARHDSLLRQSIEASGGYVFKMMGDAFCAAFATAPHALQAALDAQAATVRPDLGDGDAAAGADGAAHGSRRRTRWGLLRTAAEPRRPAALGGTRRADAALGGDAGVGARRAAPASRAARPGRAPTERPGPARARLPAPAPCPDRRLPAARTLDNPALPNNLPQQVTSFIGSEKEVADIKALLDKSRLLTLTGAGGSGKSRLSLQVAADLLTGEGDGVWLVELAPLTDPALVPQAVADVLGVREEAGKPISRTLADWLKAKRLLLILDNCEHLVSACASLAAELLKNCPGLHLLATSREPLNVTGEAVYRVPSLSLPDPRQTQTVESLSQYEAVALFIERARSAQTSFAVTDANAPAVAQVCWRLDGIPLALELAAARVRSLPVEQINARLDDRFRLLTGGSRNTLPRQQTLRALIDWSYDLLSDAGKACPAAPVGVRRRLDSGGRGSRLRRGRCRGLRGAGHFDGAGGQVAGRVRGRGRARPLSPSGDRAPVCAGSAG